jgi:hypothetical protein
MCRWRQVQGITFNPCYEPALDGGAGWGPDSGRASGRSSPGGGTDIQFATWGVKHVRLWTRGWDEVGGGVGGRLGSRRGAAC